MVIEVKIPSVGESINDVVIGQWQKENGDYVEMDEVICEIESEKTNFELTAEVAGILTITSDSGKKVLVGDVVAFITEGDKKSDVDLNLESNVDNLSDDTNDSSYAKSLPSPSANKIIKENNLNSDLIDGTGRDKRITKADAMSFLEKNTNNLDSQSNEVDYDEGDSSLKLNSFTNFASASMSLSERIENSYIDIDLFNLTEMLDKYRDIILLRYDIQVSILPFFMKAFSLAFRNLFTKTYGLESQEDIAFSNVAFLVSTDYGDVFPVIEDVDNISVLAIEKKRISLIDKAKNMKLSLNDLKGGGFCIFDFSMYKGGFANPMLFDDKVISMGIYSMVERPFVVNGEISVRISVRVALSYAGNFMDNTFAITLLNQLKHFLENPINLFLEI